MQLTTILHALVNDSVDTIQELLHILVSYQTLQLIACFKSIPEQSSCMRRSGETAGTRAGGGLMRLFQLISSIHAHNLLVHIFGLLSKAFHV